jgi:hypothetical protein
MNEVFLKGDVPTGCYVAIESSENPVVLGKGKDPIAAYREAQSKGAKTPVLIYVPENDSVFVYHASY